MSESTEAKPKPCNKPKAKATNQGLSLVKVVFPCCFLMISKAKKTILKAITASTGATGIFTNSNEAKVNVMLCAIVKAVTVFMIFHFALSS